MAEKHTDRTDKDVRAYERILDRLRERLDETGERGRLRDALDTVKERSVQAGELTPEEADAIGEWVRRDVEEAAGYTATTDRDLSTWLHMDMTLVESWIWDRFSSVADRTRLEWLEFQHELARAAEYHTGEVAGPGALACRACGDVLNFEKAGRIPPCPRCQGTIFERAVSRTSLDRPEGS